MGKTKITDEQLQADLKAGLTKKEIADKHGVTRNALYIKLSRSRDKLKGPRASKEPLTDCFAYDRNNGTCTCLTAKECQGTGCGFYKKAKRAIEEARRGIGPDKAYAKINEEVVTMIERNQEACS